VVVVPGARDAISETRGVRCYRLRGPHIPTQAPYRFMLATRSSRRIIAHERPDVIEVGSVGLVPWVVRRATQCADRPLVAFYHSHLPRLIAPFAERAGAARLAASSLAWQYLRTLDRFFATTIVASRFVARELAAAGLDRTAYVPLGVDLERFHPARREHAGRTRQWFGLSDRPLIVYAGRLAREKQVDVLLAAWRMAQRTVDAELVLVGAGPTGPELRARAHGLRVRWIPHVSSRTMLADLIAAASLVVAPSPVETFGLAAVEAMASGVPVLGADRGGVAELVERSGAGTTFPAGDADALAMALRAAWSSDLGAAGARGRAYVEREHAWPTVFNRLFAVYDGVVGA
jgi:alpha-1,6-mannosyltransferase